MSNKCVLNVLADVNSDAGSGEGSGPKQAVEVGPGSDRAAGLAGGDAGSGGRGVAS